MASSSRFNFGPVNSVSSTTSIRARRDIFDSLFSSGFPYSRWSNLREAELERFRKWKWLQTNLQSQEARGAQVMCQYSMLWERWWTMASKCWRWSVYPNTSAQHELHWVSQDLHIQIWDFHQEDIQTPSCTLLGPRVCSSSRTSPHGAKNHSI